MKTIRSALILSVFLSLQTLVPGNALAQKESCKQCSFLGCLKGTIKQKEAMRDAYNELAKKWDRFWIKTDGGSSVPINQIDQSKMSPLDRMMNAEILNPQFTQLQKDESDLASRIGSPTGCGYAGNVEIETNSITCVIDMKKAEMSKEAMPCQELYDSAMRHETMHQQICEKRKGKGVYPNIVLLTPAGKAREEAAGYSQEIAELQKMAKELSKKCGYQASGHMADLVFSGTICDLEKPFTVYGSIINYQFKFTPSSPTTGTFKVSAQGMMVTALGGGSYVIEGADTDKPRIRTMGGALGRSPVGERWGEGTIYIDLSPSETGECGQK